MKRFEKGQTVLIRTENRPWRTYTYEAPVGQHGHETRDGLIVSDECIIPYKGNEHLNGTTNNQGYISDLTYWKPTFGELVAVRYTQNSMWRSRIFIRKEKDFFICKHEFRVNAEEEYRYCEPLQNHFLILEK